MNRRSFGVSVSASAFGMTTPSVAAQVFHPVDDEASEIMPVTVVTHTLGQDFVAIRMSLESPSLRKEILLSPNGSLTVNGKQLTLERVGQRVNYVAKIPFIGQNLKCELRRSQSQIDHYTIALPFFKVLRYPTVYRTPENVSFIMARPLVGRNKTVTVDDYRLLIQTAHMKVGFSRIKFPTDEDPELVVKTIGNIEQPPGSCAASVYRQQRTPMKGISDNYKTGWVVATVSDDFNIEVLG